MKRREDEGIKHQTHEIARNNREEENSHNQSDGKHAWEKTTDETQQTPHSPSQFLLHADISLVLLFPPLVKEMLGVTCTVASQFFVLVLDL